VIGELPWPSLAPALTLIREAALDDGITKKLNELRRRQAAYAASRRRIADAQMAIVENKRLGVSDPLTRCYAVVRLVNAPTWRAGTSFFGSLGRGSLELRLRNGLRLLEILNGELELLDELLAALGGLPKLCTPRADRRICRKRKARAR
jgi:hypothetical protein